MGHLQAAADALRTCEASVAALSGEATFKGHYEDAHLLLRIAEAIHEQAHFPRLLEKLKALQEDEGASGAEKPPRAGASGGATRRKIEASAASRSPKSATSRDSASYPNFSRRGDKLIKTAYSKKKKAEYEHHAPRIVVDAVCRHLRERTRPGELFVLNDLPPFLDAEGSNELPSYQVYLLLAWLRALGVARKHGRSGHIVDHNQLTAGSLTRAWESLPAASDPPETPS